MIEVLWVMVFAEMRLEIVDLACVESGFEELDDLDFPIIDNISLDIFDTGV